MYIYIYIEREREIIHKHLCMSTAVLVPGRPRGRRAPTGGRESAVKPGV